MRGPALFLLFFNILVLSIDFYTYRGLKKIIATFSVQNKKRSKIFFWTLTGLIISGMFIFVLFSSQNHPSGDMYFFHIVSGIFILIYVPKLVFMLFNLLDDLALLAKWLMPLIPRQKKELNKNNKSISRRQFIIRTGAILAGVDLLAFAYGIAWGRFNFTIRKEIIKSSKIPKEFEGLKIVQLSDLHIGSFVKSKEKISEAVKIVNDQNPDIILFTGDFVNNISSEIDPFIEILSGLKAKHGKYSILGNHDYGNYITWESDEAKRENLEKLILHQQNLGFDLLMNESREILLGDSLIELVGVENWGLKPFPQYGDLNKAMALTKPDTFKILLSHDPTHWDEQVLGQTNIDLTLSGHTHGAQMGVELGNFRWSPVNLRYKRWGGMYEEGEQKLYVNTGIGFIGFPGRVGMPPEITVLELRSI
ncbi:MAG: metallophosphoesterase [Bacteroidetes bacterium]|nr:metallophosphoesterase [Bacteroidota bacterium]